MSELTTEVRVIGRSLTPGAYGLAEMHRFGGAPFFRRTWWRYGICIATVESLEQVAAELPHVDVPELPGRDTLGLDALIQGPWLVARKYLAPRLGVALRDTQFIHAMAALRSAVEAGEPWRPHQWPRSTVHWQQAQRAQAFAWDWNRAVLPHQARGWAEGLAALCLEIEDDFQ